MNRLAIALPLALALLAACARSEDAEILANAENAARAAANVAAPPEEDQEVAIGEWRNSLQDEFAALEFGPAGATPLFSPRCDGRRGAFLHRHRLPPTGAPCPE